MKAQLISRRQTARQQMEQNQRQLSQASQVYCPTPDNYYAPNSASTTPDSTPWTSSQYTLVLPSSVLLSDDGKILTLKIKTGVHPDVDWASA